LLNDGRLRAELDSLRVPVFVCEEGARSFMEVVGRCRSLALGFRPHIIHAHRYKENVIAAFCRALCPSLGALLVATQHGMPEAAGGRSTLKPRMVAALNFWLQKNCFHRVVVVSDDMRRQYTGRFGFRRTQVEVIFNGVELPEASGGGRPRRPFVIGAAGRLFPVKDFPALVEIARLIAEKKGPGVRFVIAGEGPERGRIEALMRSYGLEENVRLAGHLDSMMEFFREIDLFVNTSRHEGIPMGVLEAMSYGLPVVAFDVGGMPEIIADGRQGYLIAGRDIQRFAAACIRLMDQPGLYERMARSARERIEDRFSRQAMTQSYLDLYRRAAGRSAAGASLPFGPGAQGI
jgi:glycosyltransferase involved in cell wall biosynthesis